MIYVGFLLSFVISPASANTMSTAFSFWIGTILMSVSVLASVAALICWIDELRSSFFEVSPVQVPNNMESSVDEERESKRYSSSLLYCRIMMEAI